MSITSLTSHMALVAFAGLVFYGALSDILRFRIPNRICLAIVLLYPSYIISASQPVDWLLGLAVAGASLLVGFILFSINACGGGDAKFFAAVALWAGPSMILPSPSAGTT